MTRSVMRFMTWLITQDHSEGAPDGPLFEMECTTCASLDAPDGAGSRSPATDDFETAQRWALQHSGRHPTHRSYREIVTRFWRTSIVDTDPPH